MLPEIEAHYAEIAELCRRFHVLRLELFGSAARGTDFNPGRSDVDLLVTYDPHEPAPGLADYFDLTDQLAALLGHPVDLVMSGAVRNPFVRADIERSKQSIYAA
ncbi:MAG: DNA polymerase III subunit beta [Acetobacteraceae bacterium]|nr:DNA polymerase III subunit beta [Acetobacteraceae bacterium]